MNIKEVIFTDGQIISYQEVADKLLVDFLDYENEKLRITFQGNIKFENNEDVGLEFADYSLSKINNQQELLLLDDEKNILFKVNFDKASYRVEND